MLRRSHDHHRDLPARRSTALSASGANRRHQDRHLMSTIAQTRYRNAAHHCRWFSAGRGGACSKPALRLRYVSRSSPLAAREYHRNSALSRIVRIDGAAQPYRLPHPHQPNRHRARRTASRIPSRDFLLWRFANAGPQAAEFAATSVTGQHPKTFTLTDIRRETEIAQWSLARRYQTARNRLDGPVQIGNLRIEG